MKRGMNSGHTERHVNSFNLLRSKKMRPCLRTRREGIIDSRSVWLVSGTRLNASRNLGRAIIAPLLKILPITGVPWALTLALLLKRTPRFSFVCFCVFAVVAAVVSTPAAAEQVQTLFTADANTTALYLFKEGTGTNTAAETVQTSPQPPNASLVGATWAIGRNGYAVTTDAGYVSIPDSPALRPTTAITVELWVKLNRPTGDLVCKDSDYLLRLGSTTPGAITAQLCIAGSWQTVNGSLPIPVGQWTHLAMTYDSTTHVGSIYINGVLDTATTFTGLSSWTLDSNTYTTRLGQDDWTYSQVAGKIDSYRISGIARAFTPLYPPSPGAQTPPGNLVPNGDFEMGLTGWRGDNYGDVNLTWETTGGAASGQLCLHMLTAPAQTSRRFSAQTGAVPAACTRGPFRCIPADSTRFPCD